MTRRFSLLACIAIVGLIGVTVWYRSNRTAFFRKAVSDNETLRRQLAYLQGELGLETFSFDFAIPPGRKLIATFVAELNGEVVPSMSGAWHVPHSGDTRVDERSLSINFFHPPYVTKRGGPRWDLMFSGPNGHGYRVSSPFDPSMVSGGKGRGTSGSCPGSLRENTDYTVWNYHAYSTEAAESDQEPYDFRYALTVRLEQLTEDDELDKITRVALPQQE